MKKKYTNLEELKIRSFVTILNKSKKHTIKGGETEIDCDDDDNSDAVNCSVRSFCNNCTEGIE